MTGIEHVAKTSKYKDMSLLDDQYECSKNKENEQCDLHNVIKTYAIALETTDDIVKGKKYEVTDVESMGYHIIIDESGTEAYYHHSVLNVF